MKVELRNTVRSALPKLDEHPYRTGVWRSQTREYDAWDLDVIGTVPADLNGVYLRNTEVALFEPIRRYHPFDGDGMLHAISFEAGEVRYANRFVRTEAFEAEQQAGTTPPPTSSFIGVRPLPASTSAVSSTVWIRAASSRRV